MNFEKIITLDREYYTVEEIHTLFKWLGITKSSQVIRKWLRSGELKASYTPENSPRTGYRIHRDDLIAFINERVPAFELFKKEIEKRDREIKKLQKDKEVLEIYIERHLDQKGEE